MSTFQAACFQLDSFSPYRHGIGFSCLPLIKNVQTKEIWMIDSEKVLKRYYPTQPDPFRPVTAGKYGP